MLLIFQLKLKVTNVYLFIKAWRSCKQSENLYSVKTIFFFYCSCNLDQYLRPLRIFNALKICVTTRVAFTPGEERKRSVKCFAVNFVGSLSGPKKGARFPVVSHTMTNQIAISRAHNSYHYHLFTQDET